MPTYEYECTKCEHRFEVFQKMTDDPIKFCELCKEPVRRVLFPVGIVFKGSGFHINDYPKSGAKKPSSGDNGKKKSESSKETSSTKD